MMKNLILTETAGLVKKNKLFFIVSCLLDIGFIISFFVLFWQIIYKKIFTIILGISSVMTGLQSASTDLTMQAESYMALARNIEFLSLYSNFIRWLSIFLILLFLSWLVFMGLNFFIAARFVDKKTRFWNYTLKFSLFSLFFYVLSVLSFLLTIYLSVLNSKISLEIFTQGVINVVFVVLLILIKYFFCVSLVKIQKKRIVPAFLDTFKIGVKRIDKVFYVLLFACSLLLLSVGINYLLFKLNVIVSYFGILLILIPSISFARIMYFYGIDKIE